MSCCPIISLANSCPTAFAIQGTTEQLINGGHAAKLWLSLIHLEAQFSLTEEFATRFSEVVRSYSVVGILRGVLCYSHPLARRAVLKLSAAMR